MISASWTHCRVFLPPPAVSIHYMDAPQIPNRNYSPAKNSLPKKQGRELNAPPREGPRSPNERSTPSRARLGACFGGSLVHDSNSRFSRGTEPLRRKGYLNSINAYVLWQYDCRATLSAIAYHSNIGSENRGFDPCRSKKDVKKWRDAP